MTRPPYQLAADPGAALTWIILALASIATPLAALDPRGHARVPGLGRFRHVRVGDGSWRSRQQSTHRIHLGRAIYDKLAILDLA